MLLISFQQNDVVCQVVGGRRRQLVAVLFAFLRDLHDARRRVAVCPTTRLTAQGVAATARVTMVWCQRTTRVQQRCRCVTQCIHNTSASSRLIPHFTAKPSLLPFHCQLNCFQRQSKSSPTSSSILDMSPKICKNVNTMHRVQIAVKLRTFKVFLRIFTFFSLTKISGIKYKFQHTTQCNKSLKQENEVATNSLTANS